LIEISLEALILSWAAREYFGKSLSRNCIFNLLILLHAISLMG